MSAVQFLLQGTLPIGKVDVRGQSLSRLSRVPQGDRIGRHPNLSGVDATSGTLGIVRTSEKSSLRLPRPSTRLSSSKL